MRSLIIKKLVTPDTAHATPDTAHVTPGLTRGPFFPIGWDHHQKWIPGQARNDGCCR